MIRKSHLITIYIWFDFTEKINNKIIDNITHTNSKLK